MNLTSLPQGITSEDLFYQLSYQDLRDHALEQGAVLTAFNTLSINTGAYTGRSPKDKYVVNQPDIVEKVWWKKEGSDNQPMSASAWDAVKATAINHLNAQRIYVMDGYAGADTQSRLNVRLITDQAAIAIFFKNMFSIN